MSGAMPDDGAWHGPLPQLPEKWAATPGQAARCIWWSDPSDDFYGRCIHHASHSGPHLNEHGTGWYGERWDHNTAQDARPAPDLSAGLADLESELRDVTRQVALCRSTKIPCVFCEQEITRAMGAVGRWAQDVAEHERTREPKPAPELAAAKPDLRTAWRLADERLALLGEILAHPGIGQVPAAVRAKWHKRSGLPS